MSAAVLDAIADDYQSCNASTRLRAFDMKVALGERWHEVESAVKAGDRATAAAILARAGL